MFNVKHATACYILDTGHAVPSHLNFSCLVSFWGFFSYTAKDRKRAGQRSLAFWLIAAIAYRLEKASKRLAEMCFCIVRKGDEKKHTASVLIRKRKRLITSPVQHVCWQNYAQELALKQTAFCISFREVIFSAPNIKCGINIIIIITLWWHRGYSV